MYLNHREGSHIALVPGLIGRADGRSPRSVWLPVGRGNMCGLSLIEVLVVLVITSVGMLGLAGLMVSTVRYNQTAYLRSAATQLAAELGDRMRANYLAAVDAVNQPYVSNTTYAGALPAPAQVNCGATCTDAQKAQNDLAQWKTMVALQLPDGRAVVAGTPAGRYRVVIMWREQLADDSGSALWGESGCRNDLAVPTGVRCFTTELLP